MTNAPDLTRISAASRVLASVSPLLPTEADLLAYEGLVAAGQARGHFTPEEDDRLRRAFHDYLTSRAVVREMLEDLRPLVFGRRVEETLRLRAFVVAYAGACLLVRAGRALVNRFAVDRMVRRKLDEPCPERGVPRRQFTALYRALTSPRNAWRLRWGREYARQYRGELESFARDPELGVAIEIIRDAEKALSVGRRQYLKGRLRFLGFLASRVQRSALARAVFGVMEGSGRLMSRLRWPGQKRVSRGIQRQLGEILQPGDVIVTRHRRAMTNLFLPGYWPHASLHIGSEAQRAQLGLTVSDDHARRWSGAVRVLEARKDGVLLRTLSDTLAVDAAVVIRPQLGGEHISEALVRALQHEGKLYDFAFDFRRSDRLVCTEVVYRAFDGLGDLTFELSERGGHPTLSAEDLLDAALEGRGFEPVAIFGTPGSERQLEVGDQVLELLRASYRL